ncbi:MAG: hypothetical protein Q4G42_04995 [Neisseria sp.]|nr:hypothetical protein [Neisseria sp.]
MKNFAGIFFVNLILVIYFFVKSESFLFLFVSIVYLFVVLALYVFISVNKEKYNQSIQYLKLLFFVLGIGVPLSFFISSYMVVTTEFKVKYNDLKDFAGMSFYEVTGHYTYTKNGIGKYFDKKSTGSRCPACGEEAGWLYLKSDGDLRMRFRCDILYPRCMGELKRYYGYSVVKDNFIYIKYKVFNNNLLGISQNLIYEISDNGVVIYGFDYFLDKYEKQRKGVIILNIYFFIVFILFGIFYYQIFKHIGKGK